jgi:phospholipase D1/2
MTVLRARLLRRLRAADRFGYLRVYYPTVLKLGDGCINVHSKILVVDDTLVRVGSSNLSNRSMGLDTECDLAIESSDDARIGGAIAHFRDRLLGEHLGVASGVGGEKRISRSSCSSDGMVTLAFRKT